MRMLLGAIGVFALLLALSAMAMPAHACGNGTKCCWTECHAGSGCIQHCDDGRKTDEFTPLQLAQRMCTENCERDYTGRTKCTQRCY